VAGERKGIIYEAIVKIALEALVGKRNLVGNIFWNEKPEDMTIEPDLTVGPDKNHPTHVFLVTHSGSAKNSDMKFWRNIGELAEAKVRLQRPARVYSIVFDAVIKEDLKSIQGAAFDGQLVVGDTSYGNALIAWVDASFDMITGTAIIKARKIAEMIAAEPLRSVLRVSLAALIKDLQGLLSEMWAAARKHTSDRIPRARHTSVRRGLTKALLLDLMPTRGAHTPRVVPAWVTALGFMTPGISGLRDPDLAWLAGSKLSGVSLAELKASASEGFRSQLVKVRSAALIPEYAEFVRRRLSRLRTKTGLLAALLDQHRSPATGIQIPPEVEAPRTVWLFDIIGAIIKAKKGRAQAFGYSVFAKGSSGSRNKIGNMAIGTWCSCFMNQWFNRHPGFSPPAEAIEFCASILSETLADVSDSDIVRLEMEIRAQFLAKELEATLLSHRGFDPIGFLIRKSVRSLQSQDERIPAGFAERMRIGGSSGTTGVLRVKATLIKWQSVTDEGRDHKKKELCGRGPALRFSWSSKRNAFIPRPRVEKLVLVLDGTWRDEDLDALGRAGWDSIYYPDEMEELVKAVV